MRPPYPGQNEVLSFASEGPIVCSRGKQTLDDFEKELKNSFLDEAEQLINDAEQCFLILEDNPKDQPTLEKIFRVAHNIKGSANAVGFNHLGSFTHELESFLLKCKSGQILIQPQTISLLLKCNDYMKNLIQLLKKDNDAQLNPDFLIQEIQLFNNTPAEPSFSPDEPFLEADPIYPPPEPFNESMPDAMADLLEQQLESQPHADETIPLVETSAPEEDETPTASPTQAPTRDENIRVSLARLDRLLNFVGELVIFQTVLKEQSNQPVTSQSHALSLRKTIHQMGKVTKEVQDLSMSLRMISIKHTFQKMQRIIRDTSGILGKKVILAIQGEETEVDKTILDSLNDPLVHLVRNAVDHGIESPEERLAQGKPETGTITLRAYHQSGKLIIELQDNGGGISAEKIRASAIAKGLLTPDQIKTDQELIQFIFTSGFSTKSQATEISGRGIGMDVVKTNIEQLQGTVTVETAHHLGSTFKIILPLTLAIIDGMIVRSGADRYVIPLTHVHESLKPTPDNLKCTTEMGEILLLRGEILPVIRLSHALGKKKSDQVDQIAIIIRTQEKPFATLVDDVIGQHQVVIKKLGMEMQHLRGYSGSAILGDGKPALILELGDLVTAHHTRSPTKITPLKETKL